MRRNGLASGLGLDSSRSSRSLGGRREWAVGPLVARFTAEMADDRWARLLAKTTDDLRRRGLLGLLERYSRTATAVNLSDANRIHSCQRELQRGKAARVRKKIRWPVAPAVRIHLCDDVGSDSDEDYVPTSEGGHKLNFERRGESDSESDEESEDGMANPVLSNLIYNSMRRFADNGFNQSVAV
jgi:hypothetical protein